MLNEWFHAVLVQTARECGVVRQRGCRSATKAFGSDGHNGAFLPHKINTSTECRLGGEPSKA